MITSAVLLLISMFSSASTVIHDTASDSSSAPIIEPMISSTSIALSGQYELVEQHGKSYLSLKQFTDFSKTSRPVGLANEEYGWSWLNRSNMTQADEGLTTPNVLSIQHGPAVTIWGTSAQDGVFRYKTYKTTWYDYQEWVARIKSNADEKNETASLLIASVNSYGDYHRIGLGNYNNAPAVIYNLVGSHKYTNITQEEFDRGIWVRIVRHGNMSTAYYSLANQSTPPDKWIEAQSGTFTSGSTMTDVKAGFMIHSGTSTAGDLIGQFLYYDDSRAVSSPYDGQGATWAAQGYADDNPEVSLLKDFDLGSNDLTINIDQLKSVLKSTVNLWMDNSAVWTFSLVQSEAPNAVAGTFNPMESLNLEGSGPYVSIWARCQSNGFQSGSMALPIMIPLVSQ